MPIGYTPKSWANNNPPAINATNLQVIDDAVQDACDQHDTNETLITTQGIQLDTALAEAPSYSEGKMFYDPDDKCLAVYAETAGVSLNVGQEQWSRGVNSTGSQINNGIIGYISGVLGNRPQITPAQSNNAATAKVFGIATHDIANNAEGIFTHSGLVRNLDTSAFTANDVLYLSATTPGAFTNVAPSAPNYVLEVGKVLVSHATQGIIYFTTPSSSVLSGIVVNAATINNDAIVGGNLTVTGNISGEVSINEIGTASYDSLQDIFNIVQSPGIITGGEVTDDGDGTITVAAGSGIIKSTDSDIGTNYVFNWDEKTDLSLTDNSVNFICISYNSGSPAVMASTDILTDINTNFYVATVFKEGTTIDIVDTGSRFSTFYTKVQRHHFEEAQLHFVTGARVSEIGTRNIAITAGVMYAGINRLSTDAIDTSVSDTFEYYYNDATGWVESDQTQIDNLQYNDVGVGLATLSNNKYGVHWVYKGTNGNSFVIYGQGDYTLAEAEEAQPPATIPDHITYIGNLRAKIIIQKSATSFTSVQNTADTTFAQGSPADHNDLSGLQGGITDEYYHLTSDQVSWIADSILQFSYDFYGITASSDISLSGNELLDCRRVGANGTGGYLSLATKNLSGTLTDLMTFHYNSVDIYTTLYMNSNLISELSDPSSAQDAATKNYVDTGGWTSAPASASSTGTAGQKSYDSDYLYICIATDTWKRVALSTW